MTRVRLAAQQHNSPEAVGWLAVFAVIAVLSIITVGLIKDRIRTRRLKKAELRQYNRYVAIQHEIDNSIFTTVQEAQDDFR